MKIEETYSPRTPEKGDLKILFLNSDGSILDIWALKNVIVDTGRSKVANLLGNNNVAGSFIKYMGFGNAGVNMSDVPINATTSDTDLFSGNPHILDVPVVVTFPNGTTGNKVTFTATLADTDGNGENISEIGLFCPDLTMFSHITFKTIAKTNAFAVVFEWTITT